MSQQLPFVTVDGLPSPLQFRFDLAVRTANSDTIICEVLDGELQVIRTGEMALGALTAVARGDYADTFKVPFHEEQDLKGSPVMMTIRAYPMSYVEVRFEDQLIYMRRQELLDSANSLDVIYQKGILEL